MGRGIVGGSGEKVRWELLTDAPFFASILCSLPWLPSNPTTWAFPDSLMQIHARCTTNMGRLFVDARQLCFTLQHTFSTCPLGWECQLDHPPTRNVFYQGVLKKRFSPFCLYFFLRCTCPVSFIGPRLGCSEAGDCIMCKSAGRELASKNDPPKAEVGDHILSPPLFLAFLPFFSMHSDESCVV